MVVQATMLSALKPRVGEAGSSAANPAAATPAAQAAKPVTPNKPRAQESAEAVEAADLERTVQDAQDVASAAGATLQFSIDKDIGKTIIKVVDSTTNEVIRQIPSEELVTLAKNMDKLEGMLFNQKV